MKTSLFLAFLFLFQLGPWALEEKFDIIPDFGLYSLSGESLLGQTNKNILKPVEVSGVADGQQALARGFAKLTHLKFKTVRLYNFCELTKELNLCPSYFNRQSCSVQIKGQKFIGVGANNCLAKRDLLKVLCNHNSPYSTKVLDQIHCQS